jgi:hypothetical protein
MFLTIYQPPDLTTEPATWHFNIILGLLLVNAILL